MAYIGEMQYLTIGNNTYSLPTGGGGDGTVTSVGVANATNGGLSVSGSPITTAGTITIGHSNVLSSAQTTQAVYPIKIDKNGHISEYGSAVTIPTKTSDLTNDSGFITSYTDEKLKWTASTSSNTYYPLQSTSTATTSTANTLNGISFYQYYNTAGGYRRLNLGNSTAYKSTGGAYGTIRLYGAAATYYGDLVPGVLGTTSGDGHISANRTWTLPDKTGTIALTSDISDTKVTSTAVTDGATIYLVGSASSTTTTDSLLKHASVKISTTANTSTNGYSELELGNNTSSGTTGAKYGAVRFYSDSTYSVSIRAASGVDSNKVIYIPNKTGTVALTSDIPDVSGFITTDSDEKLKVTEVTSSSIYYPIVGSGTTAATRQYDTTGFKYSSSSGTTSTNGTASLSLGNSTASGTTGNKLGELNLYGSGSRYVSLRANVTAASSYNFNIYFPAKDGTVALTSDIPSVYSSTNTGGYLTMSTLPIYDGTVV